LFEAFASHDWASKWERSGFLGSAVTAPSDARNAGRTDCKPESCRSSPRAAYTTVIVTMDARVPRPRRLTQRQRMSCSPEWPDVDVRPSTTLRASGEPPPVPPNSLATTLRSATSASWSVVQDQHQPAASEFGTSGRLEGVADALDESADDWVPSYRKMKAPPSTATAWPDSSPYASAMQTLAQLSNPVEARPTATDQQAMAGRRHSAALPLHPEQRSLHGGRVLNKSRSPSPDGSLPPGVDYSVRSSGGGLLYKSRSPSPDGSLLPFNAGSSARGGSGRLQYKSSRSPSPDSSLPPGVDSSVRSSDSSLPHYGGRAEAPANWLSDSHMAPAGGSRGNLRQEEHAARAAADLAAHAATSAATADAAERAARDAVLVSHISRAMGERRRHELLRQQQHAPPAQAGRQLQQEQLLQQQAQRGPPGQPARQGTRRAEQAAAQAQQQVARKQEAEMARKQEAEATAALREEAKQRVAVGTTVSLVPKCLKAPDPAAGRGIGKAQQTIVSCYIVIQCPDLCFVWVLLVR